MSIVQPNDANHSGANISTDAKVKEETNLKIVQWELI